MLEFPGQSRPAVNGRKRQYTLRFLTVMSVVIIVLGLIDNRTPGFQSSHINKILNQFNPSTDNLQQLKDQINHYLQSIKQ
jgi:hypothetical protein